MSCLTQDDSRTEGCRFPSRFPDIFCSLLTIINKNVVYYGTLSITSIGESPGTRCITGIMSIRNQSFV